MTSCILHAKIIVLQRFYAAPCRLERQKYQFSQNINFEKFFAFQAVKTQKFCDMLVVGNGSALTELVSLAT